MAIFAAPSAIESAYDGARFAPLVQLPRSVSAGVAEPSVLGVDVLRLRFIEVFYVGLSSSDVQRFLTTHPRIQDLLVDAVTPLRQIFGLVGDVPPRLEVVRDPELAKTLFVRIQTEL